MKKIKYLEKKKNAAVEESVKMMLKAKFIQEISMTDLNGRNGSYLTPRFMTSAGRAVCSYKIKPILRIVK